MALKRDHLYPTVSTNVFKQDRLTSRRAWGP